MRVTVNDDGFMKAFQSSLETVKVLIAGRHLLTLSSTCAKPTSYACDSGLCCDKILILIDLGIRIWSLILRIYNIFIFPFIGNRITEHCSCLFIFILTCLSRYTTSKVECLLHRIFYRNGTRCNSKLKSESLPVAVSTQIFDRYGPQEPSL